tara:strand:- start:6928 stop:7887 length:960 start_codon:yes stop_codon:yes gene_type:complete
MKTIRELKINIVKNNDVISIEKMLKEELESEKPRKIIVNLYKAKIEKLTIRTNSNSVTKDILVAEEVEALVEPQVIDAVVLHQEKDILLILNPYQNKLVDIKITELIWKNTSDKIGYEKIKTNLKALVALRKTIDAERKTFNAPYTDVVSFSNENCFKLVGEIKDLEEILKKRKISFDVALSKEKEIIAQKKATLLLEKEQKEKELLKQEIVNKENTINSIEFQKKFGSIINRSKEAAEKKNPTRTEIIEDSLQPIQRVPKDIFDVPVALTDEETLKMKLSILKSVLKIDAPNTEHYINLCSIIDTNVEKIINHISSKL